MFFDHVMYEDVLLTISTAAELAILYLVFKEGSKVVANVNEIRDATTGTVYGHTDDLPVGSRVFVLEPQPGVPRERWGYSSLVYVIREVDKVRNRAVATPVLPPLQGPTPTVEGPMTGPLSPFKRASIAS
jgi:hypothetical protein